MGDEILMAQVEAAENVVVQRLRAKGLLPPDEPQKLMARRIGYRVFLGIEKFEYETGEGSHSRSVVDPNVESTHGNWSLGDYDTLEKADRVIRNMVHTVPRRDCHCEIKSQSI